MYVKPWEELMLQMVFEDAILHNQKEAEFYLKEDGQHSVFAAEHLKKMEDFKALYDELNFNSLGRRA